jgi:hypothetical protein
MAGGAWVFLLVFLPAMLHWASAAPSAKGAGSCQLNVSTPCPQFDSKEMTMTPTDWLILIITTSVVVIVFGVWFYRLTH